MSSALASATAPEQVPAPRTTSADREARRRHLAPVPTPTRRPARGPFIAVLAVLLGAGLLGLLGLNTALAQGSFVAFDLRAENAVLAEREQDLLQAVAATESPEALEQRAAKLGMVRAENPVFLRLADGKVLGVPVAAQAPIVAKPKPKRVAPTAADATTTDAAAAKTSKKADPKKARQPEPTTAAKGDRP